MLLIDRILRRKKSDPITSNSGQKERVIEQNNSRAIPSSYFDYDEDEEYCWEWDDDDDDDDDD